MNKKIILMVGAIITVAILVGAAVMIFPGDDGSSEQQPTTVEVTDMYGRNVTVPTNISRIVAVGAGALRFITYMDELDKVVAVEETERGIGLTGTGSRSYRLAHAEFASLPTLGATKGGDPELIAQANPQVIFYGGATEIAALDTLQTTLNIPVIGIVSPNLSIDMGNFTNQLKMLGTVLNAHERADYLIDYVDGMINDLNNRTKDIPVNEKLSAYVGGICTGPSSGISWTTATFLPFIWTNSDNCITLEITDGRTSTVSVNSEKLLELDPDVIFIDSDGYLVCKSNYAANPEIYSELTAVQNNKTYSLLPYNAYGFNYETILIDAYYVGKILYPDQFSDVEPILLAEQIYEDWLGNPCYNSLVAKRTVGLQLASLK